MITKFLPGFKPLKPSNNANNQCTLTITNRYIFLNKKCFMNFKGCPFLEFMANAKDHLLAVKTTNSENPNAVRLSVSKSGYNNLSNSGILKNVQKIDKNKSKHITASVVNDDYIIFNLDD